MKKLITLVICVLMGGSTFGQELVVNGNLEGEQEANWSSFWVQDPSKEGPTDEASGQGPSAVHSDGTGGWKYFADIVDISNDEALELYDHYATQALELMKRKNHDYDEAWRSMRVSSYTDLILTKLERVKEMEDLQQRGQQTKVSEGIDANYMDIINYAVFGLIKLMPSDLSQREEAE